MPLKSLGSYIAGPGGLAVLVCFFLPWISISCSDVKIIEGSGLDLYQGFDEDNVVVDEEDLTQGLSLDGFEEDFESGGDFSFETTPSEPSTATDDTGEFLEEGDTYLLLVPIVGAFALLLTMAGLFEARILNPLTGAAMYLIPSLIGGAIMLFEYIDITGELQETIDESQGFVALNFEVGWWLTVLGLFGMFAGGVMVFLDNSEASAKGGVADPLGVLNDRPPGDDPFSAPPPSEPSAGLGGFMGSSSQSNLGGFMQQQAPPRQMTGEELKALFGEAKSLIQARRFDEARALLNQTDHPKAKEWLVRIDSLDR